MGANTSTEKTYSHSGAGPFYGRDSFLQEAHFKGGGQFQYNRQPYMCEENKNHCQEEGWFCFTVCGSGTATGHHIYSIRLTHLWLNVYNMYNTLENVTQFKQITHLMWNIIMNCVEEKAMITKSAIIQRMGSIAFYCFHTVQVLTGKQNMGTK